MAKNLGFGSAADKLREAAQLQPRPITEPDPSPAEVERQIAAQPNIIRQSPPASNNVEILRKHKPGGPTQPLSFRLPVEQFNRFVALSTRWGKSYHATLTTLLDAAGVSEDGKFDDLKR